MEEEQPHKQQQEHILLLRRGAVLVSIFFVRWPYILCAEALFLRVHAVSFFSALDFHSVPKVLIFSSARGPPLPPPAAVHVKESCTSFLLYLRHLSPTCSFSPHPSQKATKMCQEDL